MRTIQRLFDRSTEPSPFGGMKLTAKGNAFVVLWCGLWEAVGFFLLFSVPILVKEAQPGPPDPTAGQGQAFALFFPVFAFGFGCVVGAIALAVLGVILRTVDPKSARSTFSDWDA